MDGMEGEWSQTGREWVGHRKEVWIGSEIR
jgi:hypothetical protein